MSQMVCAVAGDTKLESPEGALSAKTFVGKAIPVFTRETSGRVRFGMVLNARKVAEEQPVLRVLLENGQGFRVGLDQVLFRSDMSECRASELKPGDELMPAFHYPEDYAFRDDRLGEQGVSRRAWRVTAVEPAGSADLYSFGVNRTGSFVVSAGVLCKADSSTPD